MHEAVTVSLLIQMGVIIIGLWGFVKAVKEIVKNITDRHDREQAWDEAVKNKDDVYRIITENFQTERNKVYDRYDNKLEEMDRTINENHTDTSAKFQQVYSELFILTNCMQAVLEGLKQLNCNGPVTEESEKLKAYLSKRAHEYKED